MRPLDEQTILITGATDGLGRALAQELAAEGATLLIHGRDDARGREVIEELTARTGNEGVVLAAGGLRLARRGAWTRRPSELGLRASRCPRKPRGIGTSLPGDGRRVESRDGYELRFAVNYLAGYLLTRRLLGLLERSAPARIVNVSSAGQAPIDFDDVMLDRPTCRRRWSRPPASIRSAPWRTG